MLVKHLQKCHIPFNFLGRNQRCQEVNSGPVEDGYS